MLENIHLICVYVIFYILLYSWVINVNLFVGYIMKYRLLHGIIINNIESFAKMFIINKPRKLIINFDNIENEYKK